MADDQAFSVVNRTAAGLPVFYFSTTPFGYDDDDCTLDGNEARFTGTIASVVTLRAHGFRRIPTVSEWGLIIMTLLLLTAATIGIGRRGLLATTAPQSDS